MVMVQFLVQNLVQFSPELKRIMTTKHRLKAKDIFTLPDGFHPDGDGFYLNVNVNARSWVLKYQFNKKTRKCGLGSCRYVTLAQAREKVMKIKRELANGIIPSELRKIEKVKIDVAISSRKWNRVIEQGQ